MQIDNDLVVKLGDGEVIFDEPGLNDWTVMLAMDGKALDEQADILVSKIKGVSGLTYRDGSAVTVEDLKAKKVPARFFTQLITAWTRAIVEGIKGEAEAKNG